MATHRQNVAIELRFWDKVMPDLYLGDASDNLRDAWNRGRKRITAKWYGRTWKAKKQ